MLVSIIVPVYNVERYLHRCIRSILEQTYVDWELILIDDGSTDDCPCICDKFAQEDQRIKVIHKTNGGLSDARNHGLDAAVGEYVLFVDSDDFIHVNMLDTLVQISQKENADIVQCTYIRGERDSFTEIDEHVRLHIFDRYTIFSSPMQHTILCAKLYRKVLWEGIRMPVGKIHEDDATTWKLYYQSKKIVVIDVPYYYYYKNPNGIMGCESRRFSPVLIEAYEERIKYFKENGEDLLATLSSWRFCLPLMYLYLRGNLTTKECSLIRDLLCNHIDRFVKCHHVPLSHRLAFLLLRHFMHIVRYISLKLGKAHTI